MRDRHAILGRVKRRFLAIWAAAALCAGSAALSQSVGTPSAPAAEPFVVPIAPELAIEAPAAPEPASPVAASAASAESADPLERRLAKASAIFALALPPGRFAEVMETMRPAMETAMREQAAALGQPLPPNAAEQLLGIMTEEMSVVMDRMSDRVAPIYAAELSEPELDALLTLYRAPEGRSVMGKIPQLTGLVASAMRDDLQAMNQRILERVEREIAPVPPEPVPSELVPAEPLPADPFAAPLPAADATPLPQAQ